MTRLAKAIRSHRENARTRRAVNRAIDGAATPALRDELLIIAQTQGTPVMR